MSQRLAFNELVQLRQKDILVIQGENDAIVELTAMRKASENLQQLQVVIVPGGHMSYIEAPQICGEWIANFLVT
jgi:pimeloyl-ACP methyl ester carboxylesterase